MTLKAFKDKLAQTDYKTGAKKVVATFVIAAAVMSSSTSVVYAAVPAENILGDAQIIEDRTDIKTSDAKAIQKEFDGFDKHGNQTITMSEIRQVIELSNVLNCYYFDVVNYTNTTKNEVLNLDVAGLYTEYENAKYGKKDRTALFCARNLEEKPAIDAYITFSCGTVSENIKRTVATKVNEIISHEGFDITQNPRAVITSSNLYVIVEVAGQTQIIQITGEAALEIVNMCNSLDNHYNTAINNIAGTSDYYENTFAYNGVDRYTSESVWLSLPDTDKQEEILNAICTYEKLQDNFSYEFTCDSPTNQSRLTKAEQELLKTLGYNRNEIRNAIKREAELNKVMPIIYTK